MRAITLLRCAGLAVLLAVALPAPASPQLGKWVKKAIKQKIADKVEQTVLGTDSTTTTSASGTPGAAAAAGAPAPGSLRAKKGAPVQAASIFSENVLEITPELLDRLEKGLAAEAVDRKAAVKEAAKILSNDEYRKCEQSVNMTPEAQQAYQEYAAAPKNDYAAMQKAGQAYSKRMEELKGPKCGPGGGAAASARYDLNQRPAKMGQEASGLTQYQYAILKERITPLCATAPAAAAPAGETRIPAGGYSNNIYYVYTPGEVQALRPRCAKLMVALQ